MLIAIVTVGAVLVSCERKNEPSKPREVYYDSLNR